MRTIKKLGIAVLAVFAMQACSDDFFDVDQSENNPTFSTPQLTLPVAQVNTAAYVSGGYGSINTLGNLWAYTWSASGSHIWYTAETRYEVNSTFRPGTWESGFLNCMANYDFVENYGRSIGDTVTYSNYTAIAKIMLAYHYQIIVDAYGDAPYREAFQRGNNPDPAYDDAEFIYEAIYDDLNLAQQLITNGMNNADVIIPGSEDIMLNGDMQMWAKFANSLKLRILLRQSEMGKDLSAEYTELASNPYGFLGAGETVYANPGYVQEAGKQNPLWDGFGRSFDGSLASNSEATTGTDFFIDYLENTNDPRLRQLFTPIGEMVPFQYQGGTYTFDGIAQNDNQIDPNAPQAQDLSHIGPGVLKGPSQSSIIFSSYESLFLQAEAAERGLLPGNPQALYETAIAESFTELGATGAAGYYSQAINNVGYAASTNKIEAIITQKWIALTGTNGFENWIEYRRTGFPSGLPAAPNALSTTIPVRLLYPASEVNTNGPNTPDQTGPDAFSSKVFWDVN